MPPMYLTTKSVRVFFDYTLFLTANPSLIYLIRVPLKGATRRILELIHNMLASWQGPGCPDRDHSWPDSCLLHTVHPPPSPHLNMQKPVPGTTLTFPETSCSIILDIWSLTARTCPSPLLLPVSGKHASAIPWTASSDKKGTGLWRKHKYAQGMIHTFRKPIFQEHRGTAYQRWERKRERLRGKETITSS